MRVLIKVENAAVTSNVTGSKRNGERRSTSGYEEQKKEKRQRRDETSRRERRRHPHLANGDCVGALVRRRRPRFTQNPNFLG